MTLDGGGWTLVGHLSRGSSGNDWARTRPWWTDNTAYNEAALIPELTALADAVDMKATGHFTVPDVETLWHCNPTYGPQAFMYVR